MPGFTPVRLVRTYRRFDEPAQGTVTIRPAVAMVNGDTLVEAPETAALDPVGTLQLDVVACDDPGTEPPDVPFVVTENIRGVPERTYQVRVSRTDGAVVAGVRTIDLATLDELTPPPAMVAPLRRIRDATDYDDSVAPLDGQVIAWDTTDQAWHAVTAAGVGGGVSTLDELEDVTGATAAPAGSLLTKSGDGQWRGLAAPAQAFLHSQTTPAALWQITHGLPHRPAGIVVHDTLGHLVEPDDITWPTPQIVQLTFGATTAGTAHLS